MYGCLLQKTTQSQPESCRELAVPSRRPNEGLLSFRSHTVASSPLYPSDNTTKRAVMILQADRLADTRASEERVLAVFNVVSLDLFWGGLTQRGLT